MSELGKLSLVKLRELCNSIGLKSTGKKSLLIGRLMRQNNPVNMSPKDLVPDELEVPGLDNDNLIVPDVFETIIERSHFDVPLSLCSVTSSWFGRYVLHEANLENSTLGIKDSSLKSEYTVQGSIRFWMSRFYNLIEFNKDEWRDFEINQIVTLSHEFLITEESYQSQILHHLFVFETGQVVDSCDALSESKLQDWKIWTSQFTNDKPLISRVETWDPDYPNNISKRILKNSKEYKIAQRFTLTHSKGLSSGSQSVVQIKKNSTLPVKCLICVPFENAVVSVHLRWRGTQFVISRND